MPFIPPGKTQGLHLAYFSAWGVSPSSVRSSRPRQPRRCLACLCPAVSLSSGQKSLHPSSRVTFGLFGLWQTPPVELAARTKILQLDGLASTASAATSSLRLPGVIVAQEVVRKEVGFVSAFMTNKIKLDKGSAPRS